MVPPATRIPCPTRMTAARDCGFVRPGSVPTITTVGGAQRQRAKPTPADVRACRLADEPQYLHLDHTRQGAPDGFWRVRDIANSLGMTEQGRVSDIGPRVLARPCAGSLSLGHRGSAGSARCTTQRCPNRAKPACRGARRSPAPRRTTMASVPAPIRPQAERRAVHHNPHANPLLHAPVRGGKHRPGLVIPLLRRVCRLTLARRPPSLLTRHRPARGGMS